MKNTQEFLDAVRAKCKEAQTLTDIQIIDAFIEGVLDDEPHTYYDAYCLNETILQIIKNSLPKTKQIDWQTTFNGEATNWDTYTKVANFAKMCGYKHLWWNNYLFKNI